MNDFVKNSGDKIKGCISGFDRVVFKGTLLPLAYVSGANAFLYNQGILFKDYKTWITEQSRALEKAVEQFVKERLDDGITPLKTYKQRKEALAHEQKQRLGIESGLIGAWSCIEACNTY